MPIMELTLPKGSLDTERANALVDQLTQIILRWEGAPDTPVARSISWGVLNFVDDIRIDGRSRATKLPVYRVFAIVPAGALSDRRKAGLVEEVTRAVLDAEGAEHDDFNKHRVFCVIQEVSDGNWGAGGRIYRFADIVAVVSGATPVTG